MKMAFEHKNNRGNLFRNADKRDDTDRDYKGIANVTARGGTAQTERKEDRK
jgi:hypothetical protein